MNLANVNYSQLAIQALERAEALAACSESSQVLTRTFLSEPMKQVHTLMADWMHDAGMTTRVDALGNIVGRLPGTTPRIFLTGSHLDTVPDAGKFDGMLGVLIGVAAAKAIGSNQLPFHFDTIGFSDEEGVRYRMPYLGSLAITGAFKPEYLERVDSQGIKMEDAIRNYGLNPANIVEAGYDFSQVNGFAEVHIEQGPVLESEALALGAVTGLVGQSRIRMFYRGIASHAGTTPMRNRRDAFAALAELATFVESHAQAVPHLVATIGMVRVNPGGTNVIPGEVYFSLDIRHGNQDTLNNSTAKILEQAAAIAKIRDLKFEIESQEAQAVVDCAEPFVDLMDKALVDCGHKSFRLASGAGHDTAVLAKVTKTAMLFIRSPGGISHNPIETVTVADVAAAIEVFVRFLRSLPAT
jgi:allantoate deiminase